MLRIRAALGPLLALAAVAAMLAPVTAATAGAVTPMARGPAYQPAIQAPGVVTLVFSGDISPPTNEFRGDDHATAELVLSIRPNLVCTAGDNQYEVGSGAMFESPAGFNGSWGSSTASSGARPRGTTTPPTPGPARPASSATSLPT